MSKTFISNDYGQTDKTILVHFVVETQFLCEIEFFCNQSVHKSNKNKNKKFIRSLSLAEPDRIKAGNRISIGVVTHKHIRTDTLILIDLNTGRSDVNSISSKKWGRNE